MQDELTSLERELDEIDIYEGDEARLMSRDVDVREALREAPERAHAHAANDSSATRCRRDVLKEIKGKLVEYGRQSDM
jgi:hypothetical protein